MPEATTFFIQIMDVSGVDYDLESWIVWDNFSQTTETLHSIQHPHQLTQSNIPISLL